MSNTLKISPSILASDYANLQSELDRISTSDMIHIDVMDGHFVPNISIGAPVVAACKKVCDVPFDVHLMISNPLDYAEDFAKAGADIICFHTECDSDTEQTIDKILSLGKKAALAIKPATPIDEVVKYLDKISMVLVMTVEPGFGGQSFMESTMPKIEAIRKINPDIDIEVDGGINADTVKIAAKAGANVFVAGSAVFKSENPAETIALLKKNAQDVQ
ncbi:ribulose-phosphate 3-epimerase [uncultured Eubacterium sp.]|uniref:ribulose-phosphate 3-epimerase n=1 Tax=uncultured Eubacterium sp. TaxID=165185 RepID=UPI0025F2D605|nr:ribulose-phosphate 3-epimerase [uncultured Eubacterium sp.]